MNSKLHYLLIALCMVITSCENSFDEPDYSNGAADFTSYVAIGGYYTAGYGDGALHYDLQSNSFPAILASRFALAGGGPFKQPLVNPGNGLGYDELDNPVSRFFLSIQTDCNGNPQIVRSRSSADLSNLASIASQGPFNNVGIPGIKVSELFSEMIGQAGGPNKNDYFVRFAFDNIQASTVIDDADRVNPTFFTFWIGSEDLWLYARSGGPGKYEITPVSDFRFSYELAVAELTDNDEEGVLATIPDIENIPYFSAIPYNGLVLTQAEAEALNSTSSIEFVAGANPFVVSSPGTSNARQLGAGEFVLLSVPSDSIQCYQLGTPQHPIPAHYILDSAEVAEIRAATLSYNAIIRNTAADYDLALADMNDFFNRMSGGTVFNGVTFTTQFLDNSIFSSDGLYPNARGNAHIANEFIRVINTKYQSTIPEADVNNYPGNILP